MKKEKERNRHKKSKQGNNMPELRMPVFSAHNSTFFFFFFLVSQVAYRQFQYVVSVMLRTLDYKHVQKRGKLLQLSLTPPSICYHQMFYCMPIFSRYHWKQYLLCTKFSKICCKLLTILPLCLYHICTLFFRGRMVCRSPPTSGAISP